jgi:hypothetical protein
VKIYTPEEMDAAIARVETAKQNHPFGWGFFRELAVPDEVVGYAFANADAHLKQLGKENDKRVIYSAGWLNGLGIGVALAEQRLEERTGNA